VEAHGLERAVFFHANHRTGAAGKSGCEGKMGAKKDHQGEFAVLRTVVGGARSAALTLQPSPFVQAERLGVTFDAKNPPS
jgi:hypothetical protein